MAASESKVVFLSYVSPMRNLALNRLTWTGDVDGTLTILESLPPARRETLVQQLFAELHAMRGDIPAALAADERQRAFVTSGRMRTSGPRAGYLLPTYRMAQLEARQGNAARASALLQEGLSAARQYIQDFPTVPAGLLNLAFFHAAREEMSDAGVALGEADRIISRNSGQFTLRRRIELLALPGQSEAALAELQAMHDRGRAFGYSLRLALPFAHKFAIAYGVAPRARLSGRATFQSPETGRPNVLRRQESRRSGANADVLGKNCGASAGLA